MRLALDTNSYIDFRRGVEETLRRISGADEICIPFVVLAELRAGFRLGTRAADNERGLSTFLMNPDVATLWPDDATTHMFADLFSELRRAGTPIPLNDLWIAALCVQHGLPLLTRDRHFESIPRLALL